MVLFFYFPNTVTKYKLFNSKERQTALTTTQILILALIQGFTEFLPISSSGHLILAPTFFNWENQGLTIEVALHVGALGAVIFYLRKDIRSIIHGIIRIFDGQINKGAKLGGILLIASVPIMFSGYLVKFYFLELLRSPMIIGWAFIVFGVFLYLGDQRKLANKKLTNITFGGALLIGLAQTCALIPGASRAGLTITMSRLLGIERRDAARFSMLLSIPAIVGAGFLEAVEVLKNGDLNLQTNVLLAIIMSFIAAFTAINFMMKWLERRSFLPFVIYRIIVGCLILFLAVD